MFGRKRRQASSVTRIFYTTDIHGSEVCFRKFVNAGKFYEAQVLIMGGDVCGKLFFPIIRLPNGSYASEYMGLRRTLATEAERVEFERFLRNNGHYHFVTTPDELPAYEQPGEKQKLISRLIGESVERWMELAEQRLGGTGIRCYMVPGNDDPPIVEAVLNAAGSAVVNPEGKCIQLDDQHEMVSLGYSNPTPWNTFRELPEAELAVKLDEAFALANGTQLLVATLHVPPYDSGIDSAPQLGKDLDVQMQAGQPQMVPVGSKAVRQAIERFQPLLGLHGHIHESRGTCRIGRTLCLNTGSAYHEGVLMGVLIELTPEGFSRHQFVTG
jgi:uncharacterized protein